MADRHKQVKSIWGGLAMLLFSWARLAASTPQCVEQTIAVDKNARIVIRNTAGQVVVKSWERQQVHVIWAPSTGIHFDIEQLPASGAADRVRLSTEVGSGLGANVLAKGCCKTPFLGMVPGPDYMCSDAHLTLAWATELVGSPRSAKGPGTSPGGPRLSSHGGPTPPSGNSGCWRARDSDGVV